MHKSAGFCGFAAAGTAQATANTKAADSHTQLLNVSEETNAFSNLKGVMQAVCQISQRSPADLSSQSDEVFKIYQNFLRKLGNWVSNRPREMDNNRANFEQEMPRIVIAIVFVTGYVGELLQEFGITARTTRCFRNRSNSMSWLKLLTGPLPLTSNTLSQAR